MWGENIFLRYFNSVLGLREEDSQLSGKHGLHAEGPRLTSWHFLSWIALTQTMVASASHCQREAGWTDSCVCSFLVSST